MKRTQKPNQDDNSSIDYKTELMRKGIHLFSLSFVFLYYYVSTELMLELLIPLTIFSIIMDFGRHFFKPIDNFINTLFGFMLRPHEKDHKAKNLSGASYVFIGIVITVILFPKPFGIVAIAVLILGDLAAALIGRRFGKNKFLSKSLEGTLSFFIVGCLVVVAVPNFSSLMWEYVFGFIAIAFGAIAENISYGWLDDNFSIPLTIGAVYWLLFYVFFPEIAIVYTTVPN